MRCVLNCTLSVNPFSRLVRASVFSWQFPSFHGALFGDGCSATVIRAPERQRHCCSQRGIYSEGGTDNGFLRQDLG